MSSLTDRVAASPVTMHAFKSNVSERTKTLRPLAVRKRATSFSSGALSHPFPECTVEILPFFLHNKL
jgi:hypothetical protein